MFLLFRWTSLVALTLALALSISAPALAAEAAPKGKAPERVVIVRVDGVEITRVEIENAVNQIMPMQSFHSFVSEKRLKGYQKRATEELIDNELVYRVALKEKVGATKIEVDAEIDKIKSRIPEGQTLKSVLESSYMTEKELRDEVSRNLIIAKMRKASVERINKQADDLVTEEFVHEYYKNNLNKFKMPEKIHLRSILFKADPAGGQRIWNEAKKKALDIVEKARKGEDFAELAKKYSEDPMAKRGGDMGWTHKGSLFDEIDMAASGLKVGEVSEPVMTIYGYHVIKLEGREPAIQMKYDEINQKKLRSELITKEFKRLKSEWITSLRSTAKIEYLRELY